MQKYCAEYEYHYNTRGLKDDERFDKWFGFVNGVNLTYKKLINAGQLAMAPSGIAPMLESAYSTPPTKKDRLKQRRKHRALPGDDDLLRDSELL